jgi:2,3-bisphosphoglycerate-independent phosphoglycerate mutase
LEKGENSVAKPVLLIILDGFGHSEQASYNAIANARTPNFTHWLSTYPHTTLQASGQDVGLLPGTIGTSEVGHLTIGAGRVVPESVLLLHRAIDDGSFFTNDVLVTSLAALKKVGGRLHLMGLLSDAGVHSHEKHLHALIKAAIQAGITKIFIHPFLDGRDTPPRSAQIYLENLQRIIDAYGTGTIATIAGRFYAMDRDNNWDRTQQAYDCLTHSQPTAYHTWQSALPAYYHQGITDEFIPPTQFDAQGIVMPSDGIIFFNFRADRARQLTRCFVDPHKLPFSASGVPLTFFITATEYDHVLAIDTKMVARTGALLVKNKVENTLKEVLARAGKAVFSIAETEKYAHVTYFFSGGKEGKIGNEQQVLIPSIKTKDYIGHPEMKAAEITDTVLKSLVQDRIDFYLINYANADMVGHSGNYAATIKAVECLDTQLKRLYDVVVTTMDGTIYITGDHGNAESMFDEQSQQPKTSHTLNPVPFIMINKEVAHKSFAILASSARLHGLRDIAPFILTQMGIAVPDEMKQL